MKSKKKENTDPCQPARTAQADMSRYSLSLSLSLTHSSALNPLFTEHGSYIILASRQSCSINRKVILKISRKRT